MDKSNGNSFSEEYLQTLRRSELVLSWIGLKIFYTNKASSGWGYVWNNWFYLLSALVLCICIAGELIYLMLALGSFENFLEVTALAPCTGFCVLGITKMYVVSSQRVIVENLMREIGAMWPRGRLSRVELDIKTRYLARLDFVVTGFFWIYTVLIWLFNLFPLMEMALTYALGRPVLKLFPYFIWYPFDALTKNTYPVTYVTQIWDGLIAACGIVGPDCLLVVATSHISMLFELLQHGFRELVSTPYSLAAGGQEGALQLIRDEATPDPREANEKLKGLIRRHQQLIGLAEDLENIFSFSILINFVGGSIIICLVGFQATAIDAKELVKFILFLFSSLIQVLMLCWFGNLLIDTSQGVSDAAYHTGWYKTDLDFRKRLLFVILRSQKASNVTALKFSTVSLKSFATILSTSWSYFTLLRTVYDPSQSLRNRKA